MPLVTEESTRDDIAEALAHLNADAKKLARRGYVGTRSDDYKKIHEEINTLVFAWQLAPYAESLR